MSEAQRHESGAFQDWGESHQRSCEATSKFIYLHKGWFAHLEHVGNWQCSAASPERWRLSLCQCPQVKVLDQIRTINRVQDGRYNLTYPVTPPKCFESRKHTSRIWEVLASATVDLWRAGCSFHVALGLSTSGCGRFFRRFPMRVPSVTLFGLIQKTLNPGLLKPQ